MKGLHFLLAGLLAISNALSIPVKRQTTIVTDGSFEDVPDRFQFEKNFKAGGWTFKGQASFETNIPGPDPDNTPHGKKYVFFENEKKIQSGGTVSQQVEGLTGGTFKLKYSYRKSFGENDCTISATVGSQTIDSVAISKTQQNTRWSTRTKSFTPAQPSGTLKFTLNCPGSSSGWNFKLDNISISGPT